MTSGSLRGEALNRFSLSGGVVCGLVALFSLAAPALAGPQHWGFGFSYLVTIEEVGGVRRLVAFEAPLHAKDMTWPNRWLDRTTVLTDVLHGGVAVGDYWPAGFSREYLAALKLDSGNLVISVFETPEVFCVRPWTLKSTSTPVPLTGEFLCAAAGDLRALGKDQLLVVTQAAGNIGGAVKVTILTPPSTVTGTAWTKVAEATLPALGGTFLGLACGDFWGDHVDRVAVAADVAGQTQLTFYAYNGSTGFTPLVSDTAADLPAIQLGGLVASDYPKDGFDAITLLKPDGTFELRVAPARPGDKYNPGPEYTGRAYSGQWLPGNGGSESRVVMKGALGTAADARIACGAGRIFGYIETELNARFALNTAPDAQIAFVHRSPRKDERPPYGWPALNETVRYEVNVNNNGATLIPAGEVRVRIWAARPNRNADTDPATCDHPDTDVVLDLDVPPYNYSAPTYLMQDTTFAWPYSLVPAGAGGTWRKLNVDAVGERWVIAVIEYAGDSNLRNNRYEMALHAHTFHPLFRTPGSLNDRRPTVQGDPSSKEYLARKIADAVTCMWERSQTRDGQDALQRTWFDSYGLGWPSQQPDPGQAWALVQAQYEGWRELDGWWGVNQGWERFNWPDGGGELHETGHLFHPLGDLYQYPFFPVWTRTAQLHDDAPVQIASYCWGADSYSTGHTRITWPACELMRRFHIGARNQYIEKWWELAPQKIFVRIKDRSGAPVAGAEVKVWRYGEKTPLAGGVTNGAGLWEITSLLGTATVDAFGRKHYPNGPLLQTLAQIFTVKIGNDYQDAAVWGTEEVASHSRHTLLGHSFVDEGSWTWDFNTLYDAAAAPPDFVLTAAVQGAVAQLGVAGPSGAVYRLYRRWEPTYTRAYVGEYAATGTTLTIAQDMAVADSHRDNRFRATYEVTRVAGGGESLPRTIRLTGLASARGISAQPDGKLLVAANYGIANPFCQQFDGTTPYCELFYHFRFGHTAHKVVPARLIAGKFFATMAASDMDPDYRFDVASPPAQAPFGYDVRNEIGNAYAVNFSASDPFWIQCSSASEAARFVAGDRVNGPVGTARVTSVVGDKLYVDALVVSASQRNFSGTRLAGKPGSDAALRELQGARGLATILEGGKEYVVIADTGNRRAVVWDADTRYVTHWTFADPAARPAAIAAHPTIANQFFVLDRRTSGQSPLFLFRLDGTQLTLESGYPVTLAVADWTSPEQIGLAAAVDPHSQNLLLLATNASTGQVKEWTHAGGAWQLTATYTAAIGIHAGTAALTRPTDVAYATRGGRLERYAVDGQNRVVLLAATDPAVTGDLNCDGQVNFDDINPFVLALSNLQAWQAAYPNCPVSVADVNGDGHVNFDDINPFVDLMTP